MASEEFNAYLKDLFAPLGEVRIRAMFGGAGVYLHDVMFALIADERVYLKVDDENRGVFETEGLEPFRYEKKTGEQAVMSYYELPDAAYDDPEELELWARRGVDAALRAAAKKKPKKKKAKRGS